MTLMFCCDCNTLLISMIGARLCPFLLHPFPYSFSTITRSSRRCVKVSLQCHISYSAPARLSPIPSTKRQDLSQPRENSREDHLPNPSSAFPRTHLTPSQILELLIIRLDVKHLQDRHDECYGLSQLLRTLFHHVRGISKAL